MKLSSLPSPPPLGWARRYILVAYGTFGAVMSGVWLFAQLRTLEKAAVTPATIVFFSGIGLLLALVVMGSIAATMAIQGTLDAREQRIYLRIRQDRDAREAATTEHSTGTE